MRSGDLLLSGFVDLLQSCYDGKHISWLSSQIGPCFKMNHFHFDLFDRAFLRSSCSEAPTFILFLAVTDRPDQYNQTAFQSNWIHLSKSHNQDGGWLLSSQKSHSSVFLVICICPYVSSDNVCTLYTESSMLLLQSVYKIYKEK